jgi:hypothetical protein
MGGELPFAAIAKWERVNGESRHSNYQETGISSAVRKAAVSPHYRMLNRELRSEQHSKAAVRTKNRSSVR